MQHDWDNNIHGDLQGCISVEVHRRGEVPLEGIRGPAGQGAGRRFAARQLELGDRVWAAGCEIDGCGG